MHSKIRGRSWYKVYLHFFSSLISSGKDYIQVSCIDFLENLIDPGHGIILEDTSESDTSMDTKEDFRKALSGYL